MHRRTAWTAFLAGGWIATIAMLLLPHLGLRTAAAEGPDARPRQPMGPNGPNLAGPTVNSSDGGVYARQMPSPGGGTSDSNGKAIALAASIGSGESAVYYFDTEAKRLLVYQYRGTVGHSRPLSHEDKGGLRLLAARHIDYDLRLESYRDLSEKTRGQLKDAFESAFGGTNGSSAPTAGSSLPTKHVDLPGGIR
jgi:hypothetical protein